MLANLLASQRRFRFGQVPPAVGQVKFRGGIGRWFQFLGRQRFEPFVAASGQLRQAVGPVCFDQTIPATNCEIGLGILRIGIERGLGFVPAAKSGSRRADFLPAVVEPIFGLPVQLQIAGRLASAFDAVAAIAMATSYRSAAMAASISGSAAIVSESS